MVTTDKTFLREYIYEIISEIIETKQGAVEPCMAHIDEIRKSINIEVMEVLRAMAREGVLSYSIVVSCLYHIFRTLLIPGQPENQTSNPSQLTLFNTP